MAKKAVYNNKHLAIYITQDDLDELLRLGYSTCPLSIGKDKTELGQLMVDLSAISQNSLRIALGAERRAVQEVQDQFAKDHPDYVSSTTTQNRSKRARKRLR